MRINNPTAKLLYKNILIIMILIQFPILVYTTINLIRALDASTWKSADGIVISSSIMQLDEADDKSFDAFIMYNYEINGKAYTNDKINFGHFSTNESEINLVNQYPEGKQVLVYFDPDDHSKSVLSVASTGAVVMFSFMLIVIIFTISLLFYRERMISASNRLLNKYLHDNNN